MSFAAAAALSSIGDIGSAMLSQYYNKKNMKKQAELQYQYAQRYALNSPSWSVQGLRAAGLNPILAVSNGVNLGANIPNITNSSPKADIDIPAVEALKAAKETDIGQQNADSNSEMADANTENAKANMLRAKADATLKQAQTLKTIADTNLSKQDFERNKGNGGWRSTFMADGHRLMWPFYEAALEGGKQVGKFLSERWNSDNDSSSYIKNAPTRSMEPSKKFLEIKRPDENREFEYNGRKYRWTTIPKE